MSGIYDSLRGTMGRGFYIIFLLLTVLAAGGCKTPVLGQLGALAPAPPPPSFGESLERGYRLLAQYEGYVEGDVASAGRFEEKARLGAQSAPDNPLVMADFPAEDFREASVAYEMLKEVLETQRGDGNGLKLAEAQVNFDCWLERQASREETGGVRTAQWCRERFYAALEGLQAAGPKRFSVYFGVNTAIPDAAAQAIIRQAAAAHAEHDADGWHIRVTGRADSQGDAEQNMVLSMRRALAVRNALAQNGVDPAVITIAATGASRREKNRDRRVDIAVVPAAMDRPEKGEPDITKMLPQYFGPDGPSM